MRLNLRVDIDGMYWNGGACIEVPEMFRKCFEPMKTCDDPIVAYATGDTFKDETIKIVMKTRDDAAEILAKELANMIIDEMKKNDTHNGYANETKRINMG